MTNAHKINAGRLRATRFAQVIAEAARIDVALGNQQAGYRKKTGTAMPPSEL